MSDLPMPMVCWHCQIADRADGVTIMGSIVNLTASRLVFAGIVGRAFDSCKTRLAIAVAPENTLPTHRPFVLGPGKAHTFRLRFDIANPERARTFRLSIARSLVRPYREMEWETVIERVPISCIGGEA